MIEKRGGEAHSETRFTEESYNELLEKLGSGKQSSWSKKKEQTPISLFERFLQNAHNENYIVQDTTYEKAWSLNKAILNGADFSLLLQTLFNNEKFKSLGIKRTPWVNLAKIFLNVNGMPFPERGLENQTRQKQGGNEGNKAKERMKRIVDQLLQEN